MTPEALLKLEDAFSISATDKEACIYAGISPSALYAFQEKNPEFTERKETLKMKPNLRARQTIVQHLSEVRVAQWWMERRDSDFNQKQKMEYSGKLQTEDVTVDTENVQSLVKEFEDRLRAEIVSSIQKT